MLGGSRPKQRMEQHLKSNQAAKANVELPRKLLSTNRGLLATMRSLQPRGTMTE